MKRYFFLLSAIITIIVLYNLVRNTDVNAGNEAIDSSLATVVQSEPISPPEHLSWLDSLYRQAAANQTIYQIVSGDTFAGILKRQGINNKDAAHLANLVNNQLDLSTFQVGKKLIIFRDGLAKVPAKIEYPLSPTSSLIINVDQLTTEIEEKEVITKVMTLQSKVITSVANTMQAKGLPTDLADKLLSIFAWDIDFMKLLKTDQINMVFEVEMVADEVIGSGKILAAVFVHKDRKYQAYYFKDDQLEGYFDENGQNFSRAPLQYEMITSLYQRRRFHPVKRRYRAHLGMDFMAPEGTPVKALKDGVVIASGFQRANGNYVKIKHEKIITQYLHLSSIDPKAKVGEQIRRGEQIGAVGSTGLSSGPHLCLRVWENGKQKDPLNYQFERNASITAQNKEAFEKTRALYDGQLQSSAAG